MDPIHPIIPQPPTIPPVPPSPMAGKIDRERSRNADTGGERKRRPRPDATVSIHGDSHDPAGQDYEVSTFDDEAEGGLHIDVSA